MATKSKKVEDKNKYPFESGIVCGFNINETIEGKPMEIRAVTQKYIVGIYCCVYVNSGYHQGGFKDYKEMNRKMRKDIQSAYNRGAKIESVTYKPESYYKEEEV